MDDIPYDLKEICEKNHIVLDEILKRYGCKDGSLHHHGDCSIYDAFGSVCTCGLIHDLMPLADIEILNMIYPNFEEDYIKHIKTIDRGRG